MSDIEDYANSPYDDLEDILYDADPDPELADDLAQHAIHSPLYRDEDAVKSELQDYFSDWNYYSDDYMDDDPSLLRNNPQDGGPSKRPANPKRTVKRGKKRKLNETKDALPSILDPDQLLMRSIRGTIWAKPVDLKIPFYQDGQEKKVALIKDWRTVFAMKDNGWGQTSVKEDESWAKDMSLADMGLRNMPRQASFEQKVDQVEDEEDLEEEMDGDVEDMAVDVVGENVPLQETLKLNSSKLRNLTLPEDDDGPGETYQILQDPESLEPDGGIRKRRRLGPGLPSPPDSNGAAVMDTEKSQITSKAKTTVSPINEHSIPNDQSLARARTHALDAPDARQNKKRKPTEEAEDGTAGTNGSGRAKRLASSMTSEQKSR